MAETAPALDPSVRAALAKLADIVTPPPPSLTPRTWGWAVLAAVALALAAWASFRWRARRKANRYRVEALRQLEAIEARLGDEGSDPATIAAALPSLLKRVALAAWPRVEVASLARERWTAFLAATAGQESERADAAALAKLLTEGEYRQSAAMSIEDARACTRAARHWIETHRVPT